MANNNTVEGNIAAKVNDIKAQPYAKYVVAEDVIERNFGYKIVRQQVASGKNSVIYKCETVKHPDTYCVVKAYKMGKEKVKSSLKEETCQIMRYVSGKCVQIISTLDIFYTNDKLYLMCDWSARGELLASIKQRSIKLNEELLRNWTLDMLNAINFLHSNAISHRNIAPNCLLLTPDSRVKIGTLSDAVIYCKPDGALLKQTWPRFSRTANWNQAPEVAKGKQYDPRKADIWCIGATVYWFVTRSHPIDYGSSSKMTKQLEGKLSIMRKVTRKCQTFVRKTLTFQPTARPSLEQLMQLEWLSASAKPSPGQPAKETEIEPSVRTPQDTGEAAGAEETQVEPEPSGSKKEPSTQVEASEKAESNPPAQQ